VVGAKELDVCVVIIVARLLEVLVSEITEVVEVIVFDLAVVVEVVDVEKVLGV
jgi:hypothetical protein